MDSEGNQEDRNDNQLNMNIKKSERDDFVKTEKTEANIKETKIEKKEVDASKETIPTKKEKEKLPIIPYKVDSSYQKKLIDQLKRQNKKREKFLFVPEKDYITENIDKLDLQQEKKDQTDEVNDLKIEGGEQEIKTHFTNYKNASFTGETALQDPIALFSGAEKVYIDQYYKISDLFVICPLYYNYRISLEYCTTQVPEKVYEAFHLFNTKEISSPCSHNCCSNQMREIDIRLFNFIVDPKDKEVQKFITIRKPCRCSFACFCACCSRPTFFVETPIEQLGKIVEIRTICDPTIKILDINEDEIYTITTSCSDCGYCLRDGCCRARKCAKCEFTIFDKQMKKKFGKIKKDHRSGKKIMPDYDQIEIEYSQEISCQDKILIMCAGLVLEYLYFQNLSNSRRCNGNPKLINTPY